MERGVDPQDVASADHALRKSGGKPPPSLSMVYRYGRKPKAEEANEPKPSLLAAVITTTVIEVYSM